MESGLGRGAEWKLDGVCWVWKRESWGNGVGREGERKIDGRDGFTGA
jgi:hypothetical protein